MIAAFIDGSSWVAVREGANMADVFLMCILQMADPAAQLHAALTMRSAVMQAGQGSTVNIEGFNSVDDLGIMELGCDFDEMAKRVASRAQVGGRVALGMAMFGGWPCWVGSSGDRCFTKEEAD